MPNTDSCTIITMIYQWTSGQKYAASSSRSTRLYKISLTAQDNKGSNITISDYNIGIMQHYRFAVTHLSPDAMDFAKFSNLKAPKDYNRYPLSCFSKAKSRRAINYQRCDMQMSSTPVSLITAYAFLIFFLIILLIVKKVGA